jgi:hypothetical protein
MAAIGTAAILYGSYQLLSHMDIVMNEANEENEQEINEGSIANDVRKGKRKGKDNAIKGGPLRDSKTGNYLPVSNAERTAHTTIGIRMGREGPYTQGATFNDKGEFTKRTDVTNHGRNDHHQPHYHDATAPNAADSPPISITNLLWNN